MVFQWFPMLANHWSDDGMVTIHRSGLLLSNTIFITLPLETKIEIVRYFEQWNVCSCQMTSKEEQALHLKYLQICISADHQGHIVRIIIGCKSCGATQKMTFCVLFQICISERVRLPGKPPRSQLTTYLMADQA